MQELETEIATIAKENRKTPDVGDVHNWQHTKRVAYVGKQIAYSLGVEEKDFLDYLISFYFHDVGRVTDCIDDDHAIRSVETIAKIVPKRWPKADLDSIIFAVGKHSDSLYYDKLPIISNYDFNGLNKKVSICLWDADRLDILRLKDFEYLGVPTKKFVPMDKGLLNSDWAKEFANTVEHFRIFEPGYFREENGIYIPAKTFPKSI